MGRMLTWGLVVVVVGLMGPSIAFAQPGSYPSASQYADPRAASKAPQTAPHAGAPNPQSYQQPQAYRAPPAAQTPTYARPNPGRPQQGYRASYAAAGQNYVLAPPVLPYREGTEPPNGYVLETRRNTGLMAGGGLTWGGAYAVGVVYALAKSFDNGTGWLAAPLVGPWMAIKGRDFKCKSSENVTQKQIDNCVDGALNEVTSITFLAMLGLVQTVGTTLLFVGVGDKTREWVRADLADVELRADAGRVGDTGYGLTLSGQF